MHQRETRLAQQALEDALTGLPNRTLFLDRLRRHLAAMRRTRTYVGVLFLDMDDFKRVNDSSGHQVGDHVLRAVGQRLQARLRPTDTVACLSGDEFTILFANVTAAPQVSEVAARIHLSRGPWSSAACH
jgi:diguanylate cyclase (GGDEF)-like protein